MKKQIVPVFVCLLGLITLPGCFIPSRYIMRKNIFISQPYSSVVQEPEEKRPIITVWIHGTHFFSRPLFKRHFNGKPGLILAKEIETDYKIDLIAQTLIEADPSAYDADHFYIFGWSGKLCFDEREHSARQLYGALKQIRHEYEKEHGIIPDLRIIAHSHGGNVALNLAQIKGTDNITIKELILLACPVQVKTKHLIKDPIFQNIYVFYSTLDLVQILDPQGIYRRTGRPSVLFSKRQFIHQPNLAQMKVKMNRRAIMHTEFSHPTFLKLLPRILDEIDDWQREIVYKKDPNKICKLLCVYTDRKPPVQKQKHHC